jgi:hypothetical protein
VHFKSTLNTSAVGITKDHGIKIGQARLDSDCANAPMNDGWVSDGSTGKEFYCRRSGVG